MQKARDVSCTTGTLEKEGYTRFSLNNTKHSLETAEVAVIQDWYVSYASVLQSRMQSNRLDWGTKQ